MKAIEDLSDPKEIIKEIKYQDEKFDLMAFYSQNFNKFDILDYALYVVTPKQDFHCYAKYNHGYVMESVMYALYSDYNEVFRSYDYHWIPTAIHYGIITMQLMSKYYLIMWIPETITEFQFERLVNFYNDILEVNKMMYRSLEPDIKVGCIYFKTHRSMELDEAILFMSDKIRENGNNETIIDVDPSKVKILGTTDK